MKKVTIFNKMALIFMLLIAFSSRINAQSIHPLVPDSYIFDSDSIMGFDEESAKQGAFNAGAFGDEYKVYMYFAQREFVKIKYNLQEPFFLPSNAKGGSPVVNPLTAACVNEDFEDHGKPPLSFPAGSTVAITTAGGLNGWTASRGLSSSGSAATCPSYTSALTTTPINAIWVMNPGPGGCVDPRLPRPVHSVYGDKYNGVAVGSATAATGVDSMRGNWFCKINTNTGGSDIHKISKTITVTSSNAFFQFAFISILEGAHCCCDNGAFLLKVKNCSGQLLSCPQFTASAPQTLNCGGVTGGTLCAAGSATATTFFTSPSPWTQWKYNWWKVTTLDLTSYIGSCVTIDAMAIDCAYSGHGGYAYFDAQCLPMDITAQDSLVYPAGSPSITVPTCGAGTTATVSAPSGTGPYQWAGPFGFNSTNQTFTTALDGTYTLTMNPPGACAPITRTVVVRITPAPNVTIPTQTQVSCASPTVNGISIQMSSGVTNTLITPNYVVSFASSPTSTVGSSANTMTVMGFAPGPNTVTITDSVGCTAKATFTMNAPPAVPAFTIAAPLGTVVGCVPPAITLCAVSTTTLANMTYTWSSITTGSTTGTCINGTAPTGTNVFTIYGSDLVANSCVVTQTFAITQNTTAPGCTVTPGTGTLNCDGNPICFNATSSSTINIFGQWYNQSATTVYNAPTGSPMPYCFGAPGIYAATFTNVANGCTSTQTVSVFTATTAPTMTINALDGYTVTCNTPALEFNISATGLAPPTYSWVNVATSATSTPANGGYTITVPGQYVAAYEDGFNCRISQTITVMIDTVKPLVTAITNLPSNSFTLNCYNPVLTASAVTNPMLPLSSYSWTQPPNGVVHQPTMSVNTTSVTSSPTNFTVMAEGANGCVGRSKIAFYEDLVVPSYGIVFTPTAITCNNPNVALTPDHLAGPATAASFTFASPPPTAYAYASGSLFGIPGTYTMTVQLLSNGCYTSAVGTVPLNTTPPPVGGPTSTMIPCGSPTVNISAGTLTTSTSYSYAWVGPVGSAIGQPDKNTTSVNMVGDYDVVVTNTVNGCISTNEVTVGFSSVIPASFSASPNEGFAPLSVTFDNTTPLSGATSGTITTWWGYGNGVTTTSVNGSTFGSPDGSTTYQAAGSYTVLLVVQQAVGSVTCTGTATTVVNVDLASAWEIPNVFTPNEDGINDLFQIQSTNLTEITCTVFDRWGVKMYDVTSDKGNIAWDGKTFGKKDAPVGTYFYIIKATGKDGTAFEQKGTVSLYR
jgi:gliding motility-associated-like protein